MHILSPSLKKTVGFITGFRSVCYSVLRLGKAQEKILKHFFECDIIVPEGVSHISKSINLLQPSVHRSVSSLIKNKYLVKEKGRTRKKGKKSFEKALYVTDKGAAAAVVIGITLDQLENYYKKFASKNKSITDAVAIIERFKVLYKVIPKREFLVKKVMECLLNSNSYDHSGRIVYPIGTEFKKTLRYVQDSYDQLFGNAGTVREILDKYGIDKSYLKEAFQKDRERIDSILRQLEDEMVISSKNQVI
jgi:DNA-binding MarR family transcriptional regulator